MARTKKPKNSILCGSPYTFISTRPPGLTTRAISLMPFGMSGNSMTPNCDPAMSKLSSSSSSAWPSMTRVSMSSPSLRARALEQLEHDGRLVRRQYLRAEARRRNTEGTAAGRHVQEPHARTEPGAAQAFVPQPHLRGGVGLVIARRDLVPCGPRLFLFLSGHGFLLCSDGQALPSAARSALRSASGCSMGGSSPAVLDHVQRPSVAGARGLGDRQRRREVVPPPDQGRGNGDPCQLRRRDRRHPELLHEAVLTRPARSACGRGRGCRP